MRKDKSPERLHTGLFPQGQCTHCHHLPPKALLTITLFQHYVSSEHLHPHTPPASATRAKYSSSCHPLGPNSLRKLCHRLPRRRQIGPAGAVGHCRARRLRASQTASILQSPRHPDRLLGRHARLARQRKAQGTLRIPFLPFLSSSSEKTSLTTAPSPIVGRRSQRALPRRPHPPRRLEKGPPRRPSRARRDAQEVSALHLGQGRQRRGARDWREEVSRVLVAHGRGRGRRLRGRDSGGAADV